MVLDSAGETNAKDNSHKKLNTNQTTIKTDHCEWKNNECLRVFVTAIKKLTQNKYSNETDTNSIELR